MTTVVLLAIGLGMAAVRGLYSSVPAAERPPKTAANTAASRIPDGPSKAP